MRKALTLALLLCSSSSLAAQQQQEAAAPVPSPAPVEQPAPEPRRAPQPQPAREQKTPTLQVSNEEWRETFRAEEEKNAEQPIGSRGWWYIVAAVAVGVIIAAVIL